MKPFIKIILSTCLGLLAVAVVFLNKPESVNYYNVVTARTQILPGQPIQAFHLATAQWPMAGPTGTFSEIQGLENRVVRYTIEAGEVVLDSKLAPIDAKGGMATVINPGMRAITVKVNEVIGVAGFALPGNYVDILINGKDTEGQAFSRILLHRVKVLAIAQDTTNESLKPKIVDAVTLELDPLSATQLDLARNVGNLTLILRNETDIAEFNTQEAYLQNLCAKPSHSVSELETSQPVISDSSHLAPNSSHVIEIRGANE